MSVESQGAVPTNWASVPLGEVVDILDRQRVPINSDERAKRPGKVPYYGATGQVGWIDDHLFDEELVLLGEDGAPFLDSSKPKAYLIRGKSWVNNHAHVLREKAGIANRFLMHQLNFVKFDQFVSGTTRLKLPQAPMRQIPLLIAPQPEQDRIVAEIEKQFTRLDAAVAALKRVQANLKRYRAAVLKAACEGRLVPTETELARREKRSYEPASVLLERILAERRDRWESKSKKLFKDPSRPDSYGPLPEGWVFALVEQLGEVGTGATPSRSNTEYWKGATIPWVTSGALNERNVRNAQEKVTMRALKETNLTVYPPGTLLVAMYGEGKTRGKCSELQIEAATNQAIAALQFEGESALLRPYLRIFLEKNYEDLRRRSSGGVQPNLNLSHIKGITIPLPPLPEQARIVQEVEKLLSLVQELESQVDAHLRGADRLRQATLKRAFEGKLVPQDSSDEPANVLLERIRDTAILGSAPLQDRSKKPSRRALKAKETVHA